MLKNSKKDWATSLTSIVFLVIGITGVMMYFHFLDLYTKEIHEIFGLVFVLVALFHILFNWKSMRNYFSKNIFKSSFVAILIIVSGFIYSASSLQGTDPKEAIIKSVLHLKIEEVSKILGKDIEKVKYNFQEAKITFVKDKSIIELSNINNVSPFMIIYIMNSKQ